MVGFAFALLWGFGRYLKASEPKVAVQREIKTRGTKIYPHMHIVGLNDHGIAELKVLIESKDLSHLPIFIALKKPSFIELDAYLDAQRDEFNKILDKPLAKATEIERITAASVIDISKAPDGYDFGLLTKAEHRALLEYDSKKRRFINHEFITRFGETRFMENFNVFRELSVNAPETILVPEDDPKRKHLEGLVKTGVILRGRKIPLRDRLSVLKYTQLRNMAKELKLEKEFKRRGDATKALADVPGSAIQLAMLVNIDDIFMIKPEPVDIEAVENEWTIISSYAKLACS